MKEIWKDIPDYEGLYQVSNLGNIKSFPKRYKNRYGYLIRKEIILSPSKDRKGYLNICLTKNKKKKVIKVHRLVLNAFIGKSDLQCNHKNCIKNDNCLENLEWVTAKENMQHARKNNLIAHMRGENNGFSKLTNSQVCRIKFIRDHFNVERGYWIKLSKALNVSQGAISHVKVNRNWNY